MRRLTTGTLALAGVVVGGLWFAGVADAQQKEILIGSQCDRTGPTQLVGTVFCPGGAGLREPDQLEGRR